MICSYTAWRGLCKQLGYEYKDVRKDVFVNENEQENIIEIRKNFLKRIKGLKPYKVEFNENGIMKLKGYPPDYTVGRDN